MSNGLTEILKSRKSGTVPEPLSTLGRFGGLNITLLIVLVKKQQRRGLFCQSMCEFTPKPRRNGNQGRGRKAGLPSII
jgi:hypothetical protein